MFLKIFVPTLHVDEVDNFENVCTSSIPMLIVVALYVETCLERVLQYQLCLSCVSRVPLEPDAN
jgi:hypothetical protein